MAPESASSLVTTGIYRFSRHPMYLGFTLMLVGLAFFLGNVFGLPIVGLFIWYNTRFQIMPEQHALEERFGESYGIYQPRVRRWL